MTEEKKGRERYVDAIKTIALAKNIHYIDEMETFIYSKYFSRDNFNLFLEFARDIDMIDNDVTENTINNHYIYYVLLKIFCTRIYIPIDKYRDIFKDEIVDQYLTELGYATPTYTKSPVRTIASVDLDMLSELKTFIPPINQQVCTDGYFQISFEESQLIQISKRQFENNIHKILSYFVLHFGIGYVSTVLSIDEGRELHGIYTDIHKEMMKLLTMHLFVYELFITKESYSELYNTKGTAHHAISNDPYCYEYLCLNHTYVKVSGNVTMADSNENVRHVSLNMRNELLKNYRDAAMSRAYTINKHLLEYYKYTHDFIEYEIYNMSNIVKMMLNISRGRDILDNLLSVDEYLIAIKKEEK